MQQKLSDAIPVIEGYEIISKLGQGGTSSVWKARQVSLGRIVVIKVLFEQLAHELEDIQHFKHEAQVAANLKHPGIVQVYDFGQTKIGGYYFVMEYISGYSVGNWLRRKGKLEELDSLIIAHSVAEALRYAWDQATIVHCDIKPDNIMVDGDGTIKVTDLGLAQVVSTIGSPIHTPSEVYITGTPNYMSPEQAQGEKNLDCRSDIYSLGATLHHLLTGHLPFGTGDPDTIMEKQIKEPFEYPQKLNPDLSTGTARMIMKMLAKNASERYLNWPEALADIVRLEKALLSGKAVLREQSNVRRSSATIPLQSINDQPPSPSSGKGTAASADGDNFRACPFCAEPIRKHAVYCRFCGKEVQGKESPKTDSKVKVKPKLTPLPKASSSTASGLASVRKSKKSEKVSYGSAFWGNFRMLTSIMFIIFLSIYGYFKLVKHEDIIVPLRIKIARTVIPVWRETQWKIQKWLKDLPKQHLQNTREPAE